MNYLIFFFNNIKNRKTLLYYHMWCAINSAKKIKEMGCVINVITYIFLSSKNIFQHVKQNKDYFQ